MCRMEEGQKIETKLIVSEDTLEKKQQEKELYGKNGERKIERKK